MTKAQLEVYAQDQIAANHVLEKLLAEARRTACLLAGALADNERYKVLDPLQERHEWLRPEWD